MRGQTGNYCTRIHVNIQKFKRNQVTIYISGFNGGRIRKKGYQATQIDFLKATSNCVEENNLYGLVEVNIFGGVSVVSQI